MLINFSMTNFCTDAGNVLLNKKATIPYRPRIQLQGLVSSICLLIYGICFWPFAFSDEKLHFIGDYELAAT
jgi:hypothetical protein